MTFTRDLSTRRYPVAVLGAFGIGNFGNDVTLDAMMHGLGPYVKADEILCVCSRVDYARERFGMETAYLHGPPDAHRWTYSTNKLVRSFSRIPRILGRFVAAYRTMREVDVLIVAGTGCLDDQHVGPGGLPLDMAIWCIAVRVARARVLMLSVGAGPIDSKVSRVLLRGATRATHFTSYRDTASRDYMRLVGRDVGGDAVAPDLVFGLPVAFPTVRRSTFGPTVAVGVLSSENWSKRPHEYERYVERLVELVTGLWDTGHRVVLLIGDRGDISTRDELVAALEKVDLDRFRDRLDAPSIDSFDEVLTTLAACDAVVASRYHTLVAALMTATPIVSLEYGFKNRAVMTHAGLSEWCLHIDEFDPDDVVRRVTSATADIGVLEAHAVETFRCQVNEQYSRLLAGMER